MKIAGQTAQSAQPARSDSLFFPAMAAAMTLVVFIGFSRTYYLKGYFDAPPLTPLRIVHGLVFTSWMVLLIVQTGLVAANRRDIHRRLGMVGAGIAALMVGLGVALAISALRDGHGPKDGPPPSAFFAVPMFIITAFMLLVIAGVIHRARPQYHKRFMILATAAILAAAVARFPSPMFQNPLGFFGLTDVFIIACGTYDLFTHGRVHPATAWGGAAIIVSQVSSLLVGATPLWRGFAAWLIT